MGAGPTPLACTRSPQNGWSPKNGTMVVGHCKIAEWKRSYYFERNIILKLQEFTLHRYITSALRPAAVVPAPP